MYVCMWCVSLPTTISNLHNLISIFFYFILFWEIKDKFFIHHPYKTIYIFFIFHFSFTTSCIFCIFLYLILSSPFLVIIIYFFSHFSHHPCAIMRKSEWKIFFIAKKIPRVSERVREIICIGWIGGHYKVTFIHFISIPRKMLFIV
jgi:hypothetical protein